MEEVFTIATSGIPTCCCSKIWINYYFIAFYFLWSAQRPFTIFIWKHSFFIKLFISFNSKTFGNLHGFWFHFLSDYLQKSHLKSIYIFTSSDLSHFYFSDSLYKFSYKIWYISIGSSINRPSPRIFVRLFLSYHTQVLKLSSLVLLDLNFNWDNALDGWWHFDFPKCHKLYIFRMTKHLGSPSITHFKKANVLVNFRWYF